MKQKKRSKERLEGLTPFYGKYMKYVFTLTPLLGTHTRNNNERSK